MNPQTSSVPAIPGDPERARRIAALFTTVETRAQEIQSRLRAIETGLGPQMWRGEAADGFAALLAETGPDLTRLATSYGMASQALTTYATELAAAQDAARAAQDEASTASADRDRATADRDAAGSDADRQAAAATEAQLRLDPIGAQDAEQRRTEALQRASAAQAAADQAGQALHAALRKADEAASRRDAAAARCISALEEASRIGIEVRNLAQPSTAGSIPPAVPAGASTVRSGAPAGATAEQAAVDGVEDGTGAALAGATLAGAAHRVLGPAATGLVRSFAPAPVPPPPPLGARPGENAAWWKGLTPAQRQQVLQQHPEWAGNRDGIPAADRDKANRALLDREIARVDRELAAADARLDAARAVTLPPGMEGQGETRDQIRFGIEVERLTEQRNALAAVANAIAGPDRQLLHLDVSGHAEPRAAVAVGTIDANGNLVGVDTADHVAVFTPGFTTTVAGSLEGYVTDIQGLRDVARNQLVFAGRGGETVAAVAWLGYDAPQWDTLGDPGQSVLIDDAAQQGGAQLAGFLDGILASRPEDPHLTALGHSYGSTTTGHALQQVDGVDDAVLFGSPGASTGDIGDLRIPPGHLGVIEARGDFVADLGSFGGDPNQLDGVTNLSAREETAPDGTVLRESQDHSEYLVPGTTSQYNIAATIAGLPDNRITGSNTGFGDVAREALDAF